MFSDSLLNQLDIMSRKKKCALCSRWCSNYRSVSSSSHQWFHQYLRSNGVSFDESDVYLCSSCVHSFYSIKEGNNISNSIESMDTSESMDAVVVDHNLDDQLILKNVVYAGSGHQRCIICREETKEGSLVMPKSARLDLLIYHKMYAPDGVRCCSSHLLNRTRLLPDAHVIMENRLQLASCLSSDEMVNLVTDLLSLLQEAVNAPRLDFSHSSLTDEDYLAWTGWTKEQFDDMHHIISSHRRSSSNRNTQNALAIFWVKLKTNLSFRQIGSIFNIPGDGEDRRKRAADAFDSVCRCLMENFVPLHLGAEHLTRQEATKHNTSFSIEFFGDNVTIIWDGTYLYIGKSSSHLINRKTYSGQK